jgi:mono/diheme cytochrome c family protein
MNTRFLFLLILSIGGLAYADGPRMPAQVPERYIAECAACHVAYPPGFLPTESWRRIMAGLDRHYGSDASMEADSVRQISAWLNANSGTGRRMREAPPQDRITRSDWFVREHRKIDSVVWQHPKVRSAAQCQACHVQAAQGRFDEHQIHIPR